MASDESVQEWAHTLGSQQTLVPSLYGLPKEIKNTVYSVNVTFWTDDL